jgi:hypothetical protein
MIDIFLFSWVFHQKQMKKVQNIVEHQIVM